MSRLLDWLYLNLDSAKASIDRGVAVRIQNVADYFWQGTSQEYWDLSDFPNCTPPWRNFFTRWQLPAFANSEGTIKSFGETAGRDVVTFVNAFELNKPEHNARWYLDLSTYVMDPVPHDHNIIVACHQSHFATADGAAIIADELNPATRATVDRLHEIARLPPLTYATGSINTLISAIHTETGEMERITQLHEAAESWANALTTYNKITLLAISFCHCRKQVEVVREPTPDKLLKKQRKTGRHAPVASWHSLKIGPIQKILTEVRKSKGGISLQQALHLVRGHFKTYTEAKPLLGRAVGTFFWHQQLRGSKEAGTRDKDYEV